MRWGGCFLPVEFGELQDRNARVMACLNNVFESVQGATAIGAMLVQGSKDGDGEEAQHERHEERGKTLAAKLGASRHSV